MSKEKNKKDPKETEHPDKIHWLDLPPEPEEPEYDQDDPEIIPDEDPFEIPPPDEEPEPGEGP